MKDAGWKADHHQAMLQLYALQRAVNCHWEDHNEVSWYWLLEWAFQGGKL